MNTYHINKQIRKITDEERGRVNDLAQVLGPSASGKTFLALYALANSFLGKGYSTSVVLHIYPKSTGIKFFNDDNEPNPQAAERTNKGIPENYKLKMHVCIIFDEAGDLHEKPWFERKQMLEELCSHAAMIVAESVPFVVAGTASTGKDLSSTDDVYFFRMRAWDEADFVKILQHTELILWIYC